MSVAMLDRLVGAPISWGVCEVPGWGLELPVDRVLTEMAGLGMVATELGSDGYLPTDPEQLRVAMSSRGMTMVGGFVPLVLHDQSQRRQSLATADHVAGLLAGAGAEVFISAATTSWDWQPRGEVSTTEWQHTFDMLGTIDEIVASHGLVQALHPHLGTIVQTREEIDRVLEGSDVAFTLDTGHFLLGGFEPEEFVRRHFDRVAHVHLKDVVMSIAEPVIRGDTPLVDGVQAGMFCNLGMGDVAVDDTVVSLEARGYSGWYVLEQDTVLTGGIPPAGQGPVADVGASIEHLRRLATKIRAQAPDSC